MIIVGLLVLGLLAINTRAAWIDGGRRTRGGRS